MLGEVLPPAHIQQVAGELVKALQLIMGEAGRREGERWLPASLGSKLRAGRSFCRWGRIHSDHFQCCFLLRLQITRLPFPYSLNNLKELTEGKLLKSFPAMNVSH